MARARAGVQARAGKKASRKPVARSRATRPNGRAKPRAKPRPKHTFTVAHFREEDFQSGGLRTYVKYRDLGMNQATKGMVQAHVLRFIPPCDPKVVSKRHYHDLDFQMIYVLKGWIKTAVDDHGTHVMKAGDAWIQPPRIKHAVLDYSGDCEVLEIVLPADFKTVELE
jgi:uncharacterized RmlC-like cupin family protein